MRNSELNWSIKLCLLGDLLSAGKEEFGKRETVYHLHENATMQERKNHLKSNSDLKERNTTKPCTHLVFRWNTLLFLKKQQPKLLIFQSFSRVDPFHSSQFPKIFFNSSSGNDSTVFRYDV